MNKGVKLVYDKKLDKWNKEEIKEEGIIFDFVSEWEEEEVYCCSNCGNDFEEQSGQVSKDDTFHVSFICNLCRGGN